MDETPTAPVPIEPTAPEPIAPPESDSLEPYVRWARLLFIVLAAVNVAGLVLVAIGGSMVAAQVGGALPAILLLAISGAVSLVVFVALVIALGTRRTWAIHAVAPVCYLLIGVGVVRVLLAFSRGEILIPLETIGALLVLTRPHGRDLLPPADAGTPTRVGLTLVALVATYALPLVAPLLVR
jgi:hypothetical protein